MAALIPGLPVKIEGTYNATNGLVAKSVTFTGADLEQAQAIQAGVHETQAQAQKNQAEIKKQNATLKAQNAALQQQQAQLAEQQAKIAENKKAIDAAVARFGQLDDYYTTSLTKSRFTSPTVRSKLILSTRRLCWS